MKNCTGWNGGGGGGLAANLCQAAPVLLPVKSIIIIYWVKFNELFPGVAILTLKFCHHSHFQPKRRGRKVERKTLSSFDDTERDEKAKRMPKELKPLITPNITPYNF